MLQLGRLHPDEVFQYLEPANFKAFGYGILAWEWQTGLRNWAVPGLIAGVLKLCASLGIDDPWKRRAVIELPQMALHGWMLWAAWKHAVRRLDEALARWVIPLVGLYMPILSFAGRTLGESFSAAFLVIGLEYLDRPFTLSGGAAGVEGSVPVRSEGAANSQSDVVSSATAEAVSTKSTLNPALLGGAVLGLSVVARYGSAAAVIGAMLWLLARKRWRDFAFATVGGVAVALALGALDWATWNEPFHSLRTYLDFNVFTHKAADQFGSDPFYTYLPYLGMLAPWAWLSLRAPRALPGVFVAAAFAYLAAIFLTAHKEPRFIYPALVILSIAAAPVALAWIARFGVTAVAVASALSLFFFALDTPLRVQRPEQFRLEAKAWPDATAFILIPEGMWGSGGYFWLGKNIPWSVADFPEQIAQPLRDPRLNRVVTWEKRADAELKAAGFRVVEEQGLGTLYAR